MMIEEKASLSYCKMTKFLIRMSKVIKIVVTIIIASILLTIIRGGLKGIAWPLSVPMVSELGTSEPHGWNRYSFGDNSFSICVPNTVELRKDGDAYASLLGAMGENQDLCDGVIFQQEGLNAGTDEAFSHYCRIIIQYFREQAGSFSRSDETYNLDGDVLEMLEMIVDHNLSGFKLIGEPAYRWVDVGGIKAIEIKYHRTAPGGFSTCVAIYLLSNYYEMVELVISYREQEANIWKTDFDRIIGTFRWE